MDLHRGKHCMVTLDDGKVMILGSSWYYHHKRVSIFDPQSNTFMNGSDLLYDRENSGCATFVSPLHDNRPVVLSAGGQGQSTAEVLDYTKTNVWEESKCIYNRHKI